MGYISFCCCRLFFSVVSLVCLVFCVCCVCVWLCVCVFSVVVFFGGEERGVTTHIGAVTCQLTSHTATLEQELQVSAGGITGVRPSDGVTCWLSG